jgi:hypothetical protein
MARRAVPGQKVAQALQEATRDRGEAPRTNLADKSGPQEADNRRYSYVSILGRNNP